MPGPILVVEDDDVVRSVFARALRKEGHDVEEASDGEAALQAIERRAYSVVLLDLRLPIRSGFDVLATMRERNSTSAPIVIILSAAPQDISQVANDPHVMMSVNKTFALQHLDSIVSAISAVAGTRA